MMDMIPVMVDTMGFDEKPGKNKKYNTIGGIMYRSSRNVEYFSKKQLISRVEEGYSMIPGVCFLTEKDKAVKQANWKKQVLFELDFDGDGEEYLTIEEVKERLDSYGIKPFFIAETFSSTKEKQKFRVAFCCKEEITNCDLRDKLQATLMGLFSKSIDKRCYNRNRYYNGTNKPLCYVDYEAEIDAEEIVEKYWKVDYCKFIPSDNKLRRLKRELEKASKKYKKEKTAKKESPKTTKKKEPSEYVYDWDMHAAIDELDGDIYRQVFCDGKWRKNSRDTVRDLERFVELFSDRLTEDSDISRECFIFCAFNLYMMFENEAQAIYDAAKLNDAFAEPLSTDEFIRTCRFADGKEETECLELHACGYLFYQDTVQEFIGLSDEEAIDCGMYVRRIREQRSVERKEDTRKRDIRMAELYLDDGLTQEQVYKALNAEGFAISLRQVKRRLKQLGITFRARENGLKSADVDFSKGELYAVKNESIAEEDIVDLADFNDFLDELFGEEVKEEEPKIVPYKVRNRNVTLESDISTTNAFIHFFIPSPPPPNKVRCLYPAYHVRSIAPDDDIGIDSG